MDKQHLGNAITKLENMLASPQMAHPYSSGPESDVLDRALTGAESMSRVGQSARDGQPLLRVPDIEVVRASLEQSGVEAGVKDRYMKLLDAADEVWRQVRALGLNG